MEAVSFKCPRCERVSFNRNDIREGYCGYCHDWTAHPVKQEGDREEVAAFRADWPTIQAEVSMLADNVRHVAALYQTHPDVPSYGTLMAAYHEWKKAR